MRRNSFIASSAAWAVAAGFGQRTRAATPNEFTPTPGSWRTFSITTSTSLSQTGKRAVVWIPAPSFAESDWMRPGNTVWHSNADAVQLLKESRWNAAMVRAEWSKNSNDRQLTITSTVSTRDLAVDLTRPRTVPALTPQERALYTASTSFIPTDGIVKTTADRITAGASTDLEKALRIYGWIVDNVYRNPKTRGCGLGNVAFLLESGDLGGKCADINGLAVGLARSVGIPARDIYGVRVAPSRFGYKSLGANTPEITKAQHCRAEFYLSDFGWVPVDPADVRKVILEEPPGHLPPNDAKVVEARHTLMGAWEGNYVAYNDAHDVALPGAKTQPVVPFLMYPQAEIDGAPLDSLDASTFIYEIVSHEV